MPTKLFAILACIALLVVSPTCTYGYEGYVQENSVQSSDDATYIVDFNTVTHKYHNPDCIWAKRCTVHCIKITRAEAKARGGIPCKVCGGGE